jgi:hypothetical protein
MNLVTMKFRNGRTAHYALDSEICVLDRNDARSWVRVIEIEPGTIVHGQGLVVALECPQRGKMTLPIQNPAELPRRRFVEAVSEAGAAGEDISGVEG